jgi:hypothetical protein
MQAEIVHLDATRHRRTTGIEIPDVGAFLLEKDNLCYWNLLAGGAPTNISGVCNRNPAVVIAQLKLGLSAYMDGRERWAGNVILRPGPIAS